MLEEAPCQSISKKLKEKLYKSAIDACKYVNYDSVGTIEFLVDKDANYYFIEMNTRIQVEHCVTEMISNIDIVKEQIRVAMGEKLSFTQNDIKLRGHAIECRINAEDVDRDFMPCAGKIEGYVAPGGFGVRVDSHCYQGYTVPPYYDSLLAKVICWGNDRNEARRRMYRALREYVITGIKTTIPFCLDIVENEIYKSGNFDTGFLEEYYKSKQEK